MDQRNDPRPRPPARTGKPNLARTASTAAASSSAWPGSGAGVVWSVNGGVLTSRRSASRAGRRRQHRQGDFTFVADQRQPHRLRQGAEPGRRRHVPAGGRPDQRAPDAARPADPHRRPHAPGQAGGVRHRRADRSKGAKVGAGVLRARRARRLHRRRRSSTSIATARARRAAGWHSFDHRGVHFIGLVNVPNLKPGGLGVLGERAARLAEEGRRRPLGASTPIVVFAHVPLWTVYPKWGWGTEDGAEALGTAEAVRLGHRPQRPHPPGAAEGGGERDLPHRPLDRLPAARARQGRVAGPDEERRRRSGCAACWG